MTAEPAYRGSMAKAVLAALGKDPTGRRVLEAFDPDAIATIDRVARLSWVPATLMESLNGSFLDAVGPDQYREFWRGYAAKATESPLIGALFSGTVRIFGLHPGGVLRALSRSWSVTTRGVGSIECDVYEQAALVRMGGVPRECRHLSLQLSIEGSTSASLEMTRHTGTMTTDASRFATDGVVEYQIAWEARDHKTG